VLGSPIPENTPGAEVGQVVANDPDEGDVLTLSVSDARFEIVAGVLRLKPGISLNYEATPAIPLTITATDAGELSTSLNYTVQVANVPEGPTDLTLSRLTVFANIPGAWIAGVNVVDPDASSNHFISKTSGPFAMEVRDGQLYLAADEVIDEYPPGTQFGSTFIIHEPDAPGFFWLTKSFVFTIVAPPPDWQFAHQWAPNPYDVNADGQVTALDVALVVNLINARGSGPLTPAAGGTLPPLFYDVSGDNEVSAVDAILVRNLLNAGGVGAAPAESEAPAKVDPTTYAASLEELFREEWNAQLRLYHAWLWQEDGRDSRSRPASR
jgi:hypothetical protein